MTRTRNAGVRGWTLIELMVGLTLGLLVAAAGAVLVYTLHAGYTLVADDIQLEQRGQQALDMVSTLLRHAGWHPAALTAALPPPISGSDDCGQPSIASPPGCARRGVGGSDAVLIRFGGTDDAGNPAYGDRYVTDCSGYPLVPRGEVYARGELAQGAMAINLLYVGHAADGEPQLLCRYVGRDGGWSSGALVRGVETLQLRYGIARNGDGRVDRFLRASELAAMGVEGWRALRAVQVALVVRGQIDGRGTPRRLPLLPARSATDVGDDISFTPASRPGALRRVFATTVWLRNAPFCGDRPC